MLLLIGIFYLISNVLRLNGLSLVTCLAGCLYYICKALEKDMGYTKAWVLKEKIFEEQPCLRRDSMKLFSKLYVPLFQILSHARSSFRCTYLVMGGFDHFIDSVL